LDMLTTAKQYWKETGKKPLMEIHVAGFISEQKQPASVFSINPVNIRDIVIADLIIIPSLSVHYRSVLLKNQELIEWLRNQYKMGAEIASICTGAFLLAATGLLDKKSCSTHWGAANDFRMMFPNVNLQTDKLITADSGIYTNGGSYSFLNLILFLIEKYFDRETAIFCSKMFQIDMERALQSPFIIFQAQKSHGDEMVRQAQTFLEENLKEKISFDELASNLATSRRNFDRRFSKATGNSPAEYMQRIKIEMAKTLLEKGRKNIFEVMDEVGYADDKAFREVFKKITGLSPIEYRKKYSNKVVFV
jgi:transcriptional regulator GlxA family with amidase domain